ncbi:hypothetical protein [uncultured Paludibaculum sp.]|uniref:hypothetical protein n=1 Tax=uncultured Paludibaculum sp. TaxID=1765020 RepID=UPI002AAB8548|nr:hypothetical protein [uncultured Paludibaculum sp.]
MPTSFQFTDPDYSAVETARRVQRATGCAFAVATSCVYACGGDFKRAVVAVKELRAERGRS